MTAISPDTMKIKLSISVSGVMKTENQVLNIKLTTSAMFLGNKTVASDSYEAPEDLQVCYGAL